MLLPGTGAGRSGQLSAFRQDLRKPTTHGSSMSPLIDVEVGTTQPGAADPDDHVVRAGDLGLGYILDDRTLLVTVATRLPTAGLAGRQTGDTGWLFR